MTARFLALLLIFTSCESVLAAGDTGAANRAGIDEFNRALIQATNRMDNAATLALWEDDGVNLLPQTKPIVGKKAIAAFYDDVTKDLAGARMEKFDLKCFDIEIAQDWATEWCTEHQHVFLPAGKPPFDGWGTLLLVLHRGTDGKWRLRREMWNEAQPGDQHGEK
jgi:ketosteroid isomerase-like protein